VDTLIHFKKESYFMKYLHTMIRVGDIDAALDFFVDKLGMVETRRKDVPEGKFTLIFLAADQDLKQAKTERAPEVELTYNWDSEETYTGGRNFGHLAFTVQDIYATCAKLMAEGVTINRPPRDGRMAFVKSPDGISLELLQEGEAQAPAEPWASMENTGSW
tara:strand:+ start:173 stop:655 length:483 start_codon:yes stop_codon:yes gene_type:complete